jgi:4-amino-4-deoxy-L-arabinose transferase-like glycosyltransferase
MRPLTAFALVAAVAGPWYVAVSLKTHGEFLAGFFGVHHFGRFLSPMDNHSGSVFYYPVAICVGFFPWIVFLGPSAAQWLSRIRQRHAWHPGDVLCAAWLLVWVGFFSLASTKFPHYVVPAYPALALVTAAFVERWVGCAVAYGPLARRTALGTIAIAGIGIFVVVPIVAPRFLEGDASPAWVGVPLVAGAAVGLFLTEQRRLFAAAANLAGMAVVFLIALFAYAAVRVDRHQTNPMIGQAIREHAAGARPQIGLFHSFRPGLVYYSGNPVEILITPESAVAAFTDARSDGTAPFVLTTESLYERLAPSLPSDVVVLDRRPLFLKGSKELVLLGRCAEGAAPLKTAVRP